MIDQAGNNNMLWCATRCKHIFRDSLTDTEAHMQADTETHTLISVSFK